MACALGSLPLQLFDGRCDSVTTVTAQVVSCLTCGEPTHGVWGQEQWVRRGIISRAVVPIATNRHPGWGFGGE